MARPARQGVDYFPLDVHIDDKIKFIIAKFRWEGFGIVIGIFQHIYSQGYWCSWTDDEAFLYADDHRIEYDLLKSIIKESLTRGLFNAELYKQHKILTSKGIQKRYVEIIKRRVNVAVEEQYVLIDATWGKQEAGNMSTSCKQNESKSTQSKVNRKESKSLIPESKPDQEKPKPIKGGQKPQTLEDIQNALSKNYDDSPEVEERRKLSEQLENLGCGKPSRETILTTIKPKWAKEGIRIYTEMRKSFRKKGEKMSGDPGKTILKYAKDEVLSATSARLLELGANLDAPTTKDETVEYIKKVIKETKTMEETLEVFKRDNKPLLRASSGFTSFRESEPEIKGIARDYMNRLKYD